MTYGKNEKGEGVLELTKDEVEKFEDGEKLEKIICSSKGTFRVTLKCTAMTLKDKKGKDLLLGNQVDVPAPNKDDLWNLEFQGTVVGYKDNTSVYLVDASGNHWDIETSRLEKVEE